MCFDPENPPRVGVQQGRISHARSCVTRQRAICASDRTSDICGRQERTIDMVGSVPSLPADDLDSTVWRLLAETAVLPVPLTR